MGRAAMLTLLASAACSASGGGTGTPPVTNRCFGPGGAPQPLAHLGPDRELRVLCGTKSLDVIADVANLAGDELVWSASLDGDRTIFSVDESERHSCPDDGTGVVLVSMTAPLGAVPGDAFEANVTVRARGDAFPAGTIKVRLQIITPSFSIDTKAVDFGDVPNFSIHGRVVNLTNTSGAPVYVRNPAVQSPFGFSITSQQIAPSAGVQAEISVEPQTVGEFWVDSVWSAAGTQADVPEACRSAKTIAVHARVVDVADASAPDALLQMQP